MAKLYTLLKADEAQVRKIITKELKANGYVSLASNDFIYAEGSIPVLLVAHYDTVPKPPKSVSNANGILSAKNGLGADDRAGIYAILELIKKHHCHVLFTGGEETGCIGATAFTRSGIKPDVNYIIELDRRGDNDAVYYDGDNPDFEAFIDSFGWKTAQGSCTDICEIAPYLGVMGVNLSIGYHKEHTKDETLDTRVMNTNIERVGRMFEGAKFEWKEAPRSALWDFYDERYYGYGDYGCYDQWLIMYKDKDDIEKMGTAEGFSEEEIIGSFLMRHPDVCYHDIIDCLPSDYCDDEVVDKLESGDELEEIDDTDDVDDVDDTEELTTFNKFIKSLNKRGR